MAESEPSKYAHFEKVEPSELLEVYARHGNVAQKIHQDILREFTGNNDLTVDLVIDSPLQPNDTTFENLSKYDVVSVSTEIGFGSIFYSTGISDAKNVLSYIQNFEEGDMPVYVVSAGNNGDTHQMAQPRVADLARNSLVVGEANNGNGQQTYIEDHSSRINPTLASDNPFNRGDKYQYYNVSPSLEGHEDLIREWIIQREVDIGFKLVKDFNKDLNLGDEYWSEAYSDIYDAKYKNYTETKEGKAWLQEKVEGYMANPKTLHKLVMEQIRESHDVDENGFTSDVDGGSVAR